MLNEAQQMNPDRKTKGKRSVASKNAAGAMHRIRIRGLLGLGSLEVESENSGLIFAIVLLVVFAFSAAIYMLKTL